MCSYDQVCNLGEDRFAWITAKKQNIPTDNQGKENSLVYKKITHKSCELMEFMNQNFENGRTCGDSRECLSSNCN